jgi:tetratricopeptide (TPR) repeat protein
MSDPSAEVLQWPKRFHDIVARDPLNVLDPLSAAYSDAEQSGDQALQMAIASNVLSFMLLDCSRFSQWPQWIERFENASDALAPLDDKDIRLIRDTGDVACSLIRGDLPEEIAPHGERLKHELGVVANSSATSVQKLLAAIILLRWFEMSRDTAAAQSLNAETKEVEKKWRRDSLVVAYLCDIWSVAWTQYMHFADRSQMQTMLGALDEHISKGSSPQIRFRVARQHVDIALNAKDHAGSERALRSMLSAMQSNRPMEQVIYNSLAMVNARMRSDLDTALLHMHHMRKAIDAAECPPSVASIFQLGEGGIYVARGEYTAAIDAYERCAKSAYKPHAPAIRGYALLARALQLHSNYSHAGAECDEFRDALKRGLSAMQAMGAVHFFVTLPNVRAKICALALREDIEAEFVRDALKLIPETPPEWADEHWPWALSLRCFGGFESVTRFAEGKNASKATSRPLHLLMLIAAHGQQGITVTQAMDYLWPDQDGDQAENSLSTTLLRLRRLYSVDDVILRDQGWLRLNPEKTWTDVRAIESLLERVLSAEPISSEQAAMQHAVRLFSLYRGDCLRGVDDVWVDEHARRFKARVSLAARRLIRDCSQQNFRSVLDYVLTNAVERHLELSDVESTVRAA